MHSPILAHEEEPFAYVPTVTPANKSLCLQRLKLFTRWADGWSGAIMTFGPQHGTALSGAIKDKDDYTRAVLLTELLADHLPQLPWFLRNLQCALEDSSTVLENVCAALEAHPRICSDFIRISCIAEPAHPIAVPLDQLVVLMGKDRVWTTVIAAFLLHELNSSWSSLAQKEIAAIGISRANTALATVDADDSIALEQAYVAGVLSIIGLLPLLHFSGETDRVPEWLDISPEAAEKQRETFGTDFLELGRWAQLLWKLPMEGPDAGAEFEQTSPLVYSRILPKETYSPLALNSGSENRNLVLVPKGNV